MSENAPSIRQNLMTPGAAALPDFRRSAVLLRVVLGTHVLGVLGVSIAVHDPAAWPHVLYDIGKILEPALVMICVVLALASPLGGCVRAIDTRGENWWSVRTAHVHLTTDVDHDRCPHRRHHGARRVRRFPRRSATGASRSIGRDGPRYRDGPARMHRRPPWAA